MSTYYPLPQPEELTKREKEDGMGAYLMMFASTAIGLPLPIINLIASVIYYYTNRQKGRYVHFHCLQSLLSQLPTSILNAIAVFWTVRIFLLEQLPYTATYKGFIIAVILANIAYLIFSLVAATRARKGRMYYMLFFGPLSYRIAFRQQAEDTETISNKPPKL